jgi:hypothetical protein
MSETITIEEYRKLIKKGSNKFHAQKTEYNGRTYHSAKEARYAAQLHVLKKSGEIRNWIPQYTLKLFVNGKHITDYRIDFKVIHNDNSIELIEVKGVETEAWKLKWRLANVLIDEIEPGAKLTLIK